MTNEHTFSRVLSTGMCASTLELESVLALQYGVPLPLRISNSSNEQSVPQAATLCESNPDDVIAETRGKEEEDVDKGEEEP